MRTTVLTGVVLTMAFGLLACGKSPAPSGLLVIEGTLAPTAVGQTFQLTATAEVGTQAARDVTAQTAWSTTNPSVATVSTGGLVTITGFGSASISARYQSLTATRPVNASRTLNIGGVLEPRAPGQTFQLTAYLAFSNQSTTDVTSDAVWESSNLAVATVSAGGLVTITGFGFGSIVVKYQSLSATRPVNVVLDAGNVTATGTRR